MSDSLLASIRVEEPKLSTVEFVGAPSSELPPAGRRL
jgi:hypothetical protein